MDWHSFGEYIDRCNKNGMAANIVPLVGYSAIRGTVMGMDCCREATTEELDKLEALTEKCMKEGAFGISTGTDPNYVPGPFATKEETKTVGIIPLFVNSPCFLKLTPKPSSPPWKVTS